MERNSLIPWRYSRWNSTFMGLVFMCFGIAYFLKNGQQLHFAPVLFFAGGIGCIIYSWTGLFDRWRRKRGYYAEINPPLVPNLLIMVGQIVFFTGLGFGQFGNKDILGYSTAFGFVFIVVGGLSLFIMQNKNIPASAYWGYMKKFSLDMLYLIIFLSAAVGILYLLNHNDFKYPYLILIPALLFAVAGVVIRLKLRRKK